MQNNQSNFSWDTYRSPGSYILEFYKKNNYDVNCPLWLNLGFWCSENNYFSACENLTNWIIEESEFKKHDNVLDVGSGFCQPAIHIAQKNPDIKISSININDGQIEIAKKRIEYLKLDANINVSNCSATQLRFPDESFDIVFALESAFHFNTRNKFLKEAFRVLKKKGRLIIADMISEEDLRIDLSQQLFIENYGIAVENLIGIQTYEKELISTGFKVEKLISIKKKVYPFAAKLSQKLSEGHDLSTCKISVSSSDQKNLLGIDLWKRIGLCDFVLVSCTKI